MLQYLLAIAFIDIIAGNFIYDLFRVPENKPSDILTNHVKVVYKTSTKIFIKKTLMENVFTKAALKKTYFSDHDTEKNAINVLY